ncbi:hypothetical protein SMD11_0028 [Streptomyces albireticuli]|uniref:Uncharacterized protein n=1 Tax=Streptomyces albireticuli TaxID=1940 RepID=A0A1Z2KUK8_9ACTN|nr:hypothetical protein [Streptomyces albireticuli]ARZ65696.1 hypothetical protein SMD11_0028 [Streptomyces albireticuli]
MGVHVFAHAGSRHDARQAGAGVSRLIPGARWWRAAVSSPAPSAALISAQPSAATPEEREGFAAGPRMA